MCKIVNEGENQFLLAYAVSRVSLSVLLKRGQIGFIYPFSRVPEKASKDGGLQWKERESTQLLHHFFFFLEDRVPVPGKKETC